MFTYVLKRILYVIPIALAVSAVCFSLVFLAPGDPLSAVLPPDATTELIERLKAEPISERELQRTKNQFARDYILGRESNQQKALQLAHAAVIHHDITTADGEFDIFQNMTAADVQRVARTFFTAENRIVLTILPSGNATAGAGR